MVGGDTPSPLSFQDFVLNSSSENGSMANEWEKEDVALNKDDVWKEIVDGVPTIDFFERVYDLLDASMSKTLIIKLLGRRMGYNALWNKICAGNPQYAFK